MSLKNVEEIMRTIIKKKLKENIDEIEKEFKKTLKNKYFKLK